VRRTHARFATQIKAIFMSGDTPALTDIAPNVAEIRLRRPDSANRFEPRDLDVLIAHCDAIDARPDVHAVVLAADGKIFSAGFDLNALTAAGAAHRVGERHGGERRFEQAADRLARLRPILIAAIDGAVVGGSTDFAFACDLRIGTPRAKLQMPAAKIGIPLYAGALQRYVARLGIDTAKRLIFRAEMIGAEELHRLGVLTELVAEGQAEARARVIAQEIALLPAEPLAAMKRALNAFARGSDVTAEIRADLDRAYDPAVIAARVAAARAGRA
jgi:enoyl-CoA hydratase